MNRGSNPCRGAKLFLSGPDTGVDDDFTLRMNREAFEHYQLRVRRLVDVSKADLKTEVFGATWDMPIYVSAVGGLKAFHPDGELATARAARAKRDAVDRTYLERHNTCGAIKYARDLGSAKSRSMTLELRPFAPISRKVPRCTICLPRGQSAPIAPLSRYWGWRNVDSTRTGNSAA